jgi:hypothetical protein
MSVKIESVNYYSGAPAWLGSYRFPGYWIMGRGFGTRPGLVTINGEAQNVVSWKADKILIAKPPGNPLWHPARAPEVLVEVTTAKRCRMASNDASFVMAA